MAYAKNLCDLMQKTGTSSYKLAKSVGVHVSTVTNWKDGGQPKLDHLRRVADYFGVTVDDLLRDETMNNK